VPRESAAVKGRRLLAEGRLAVLVAGDPARPGLIVAECKGDSGAVYSLGYDPRSDRWGCTCPALGRCSHLVALMLVTRREI
jgi:uncharacterized Zn finger protein